MELGNIMFGNSRGEFEIPRIDGFENEMVRLFNAYAPGRDNSWREYGEQFENNVFSVFPYYWGECTCEFDSKKFTEKHSEECYQSELDRMKLASGWVKDKNGWMTSPKGLDYKEASKIEDGIYEKLCKKHNVSYPEGCAIHCTCDYEQRYIKWLEKIGYPNGHKEECLTIKPNFHYKPTNYRMKWYKYPLRDSYANQDLTLEQFKDIIDKCIKSVDNTKGRSENNQIKE
jgi:hypothetical protein